MFPVLVFSFGANATQIMALSGKENQHFVEEVVENGKENTESSRYSTGELFLVEVLLFDDNK